MTKARILVVEDEAIVARDIRQQLVRLGYEPVAHANSGALAIQLAGELQPSLVLMDINLAGRMDGIDAASAIRDRWAIPVVFLTAFNADDILARAKLVEPYGYILKPFSERELQTTIEMALYKRHAEARLGDSLRHSQTILDNMVDGVITIDDSGTIESFNLSATNIFGYQAVEVLGQNVKMLMPEPYASAHDGHLDRYHRGGSPKVIGIGRTVNGQRKDGSVFPMDLAVSRIEYQGRQLFIGLVRDITQRMLAEAEIERLAFYDALTGLPNRALLVERLRMLSSEHDPAQIGALLLIDLDHFKNVNDVAGYPAGDLLLKEVARRLVHHSPEGTTVARLGGDEFVVMLRRLAEDPQAAAESAGAIAQSLRVVLGEPYLLGAYECSSTPSIGVTIFRHAGVELDTVLQQADLAMYQAKAEGRNAVCFFDQKLQANALADAALASDLRQAVGKAQFELHYQPQVDLDGRISGVEALIRWRHPVRGMVSPAEFIPMAEISGLILPIGEWVLTTACEQLVRWARRPETEHLVIAVNVSARQFAQADFVDQVLAVLDRTGANRERLKLELTESMLAANIEEIIARMGALKRQGVGFSLDDFGTGFSSLSYLNRLPLDQMKIDQSFVRNVLVDANAAAIARAVIALGSGMGLAVIAEGVETEGQRQFLADNGCHAYQGYLFSRPLPVDALEAFMAGKELTHGSAVELVGSARGKRAEGAR